MMHVFIRGPWRSKGNIGDAHEVRRSVWATLMYRVKSRNNYAGYYPTYDARNRAEPSFQERHIRYRARRK